MFVIISIIINNNNSNSNSNRPFTSVVAKKKNSNDDDDDNNDGTKIICEPSAREVIISIFGWSVGLFGSRKTKQQKKRYHITISKWQIECPNEKLGSIIVVDVVVVVDFIAR